MNLLNYIQYIFDIDEMEFASRKFNNKQEYF